MKKKGIVIASIVALILIVSITCIFGYYSSRDKTRKEVRESLDGDKIIKQCKPFTGGSYTLKFDTNGGDEIEDMNVCIACSPDSYKDIPIPVKEGYKFLGWFTDKEFTNPIHFTNTKDLKSVPEYDEDKCMIGYQDIKIYAKWDEIQLKIKDDNPQKITGDSQSGNNYRSSGGNNDGQSVQNTVPDYPMPPVNTTKVYKPNSMGLLRGGYGRLENNNYQKNIIFQINNGDRNLYPINDGIILGFVIHSSGIGNIIYKTNIDGRNYYVWYYSLSHRMRASRDYSDINNRMVSFNNPIVSLTYDNLFPNTVSNCYRIVITPAFLDGDINNEINQFSYILNKMSSGQYNINPNMFFKLNQGEVFYER